MSAGILSIPSDIVILVMHYLAVGDLAALTSTCKMMHSLVEEFGWSLYLRLNPRPSHSLSKSVQTWSPYTQVRINTITDRHWHQTEFVARPLSKRWTGKLQPLLAINASRLLIAAGTLVYSYVFRPSTKASVAPSVRLECVYSTSSSRNPQSDITGLACVDDAGLDRTIFLGYDNGIIERVVLPPFRDDSRESSRETPISIDDGYRSILHFHGEDIIESLSTTSSHLLSLSSNGTAGLTPLTSAHTSPQTIELDSRSWSSYLSNRSSTPYAAFGTSDINPLTIHHIQPSHISSHPSILLSPSLNPESRPSAVYAIDVAPPFSPWGASDQIIISGWYDGFVRVHDLRSSSRLNPAHAMTSPDRPSAISLIPTLTFADPWSFEPIYSLSSGGGSGAYIAAGSARHSVVSFFDVRKSCTPTSILDATGTPPTSPTTLDSPHRGGGWSVHAPGNDSSPVYSLIVDGPRVYGANQSRGFVFDFGLGVQETTYPALDLQALSSQPHQRRPGRGSARHRADEELKRSSKNPAGFYVTQYPHDRSSGF